MSIEIINLDPHIYGKTCFEDNVEDEWFIVFLLKQLTLFDPDLLVKVVDEDGEFLLIESADYLERWAQNPEKTENRVYLFRGAVHLLSPKLKPNNDDSQLNQIIQANIKVILNNSDQTKCNDAIQKCLDRRLKDYPDNLFKSQHRTMCYLPSKLAYILAENPKLIAAATRAFYFRTPDDCKYFVKMENFPPNECIATNVKFTKCLYAQLTSQKFIPDPRSGWDLTSKNPAEYHSKVNGIKVASGFEILLCNFLKKIKTCNNVNLSEDQFWKKFIAHFEGKNYFESSDSESFLHRQKLTELKATFKQTFNLKVFDNFEDNVGYILFDYNTRDYRKHLDVIKQQAQHEPVDNDDWLNIVPVELDRILNEKFGASSSTSADNEEDIAKASEQIVKTLKNFVYHENSGLKGAEAPKETSKEPKLKLDEKEFSTFLHELNFLVENKVDMSKQIEADSSDSDMDEYEQELESSKKVKNPEITAYMKQMDSELAKTAIGKSFTKKAPTAEMDSDDDEDVGVNVLSNILESHHGESEVSTSVGPATTLFASMGTRLPDVEKKWNFDTFDYNLNFILQYLI